MKNTNNYLRVFTFFLLSLYASSTLWANPVRSTEPSEYIVKNIFISNNEKLSEDYILKYFDVIQVGEKYSLVDLKKKAEFISAMAQADIALLDLYVDIIPEDDGSVIVDVLVAEMSLAFIPSGGDAYGAFGFANTLGEGSSIWTYIGYNIQGVKIDKPYIGGSSIGMQHYLAHEILDPYDYGDSSMIRSDGVFQSDLYIQTKPWLRLGIYQRFDSYYFYQKDDYANDWRVGPNFEFDIEANEIYNIGIQVQTAAFYSPLGNWKGGYGDTTEITLSNNTIHAFRPSLRLFGAFVSDKAQLIKSPIFSSNRLGSIAAATELDFLFRVFETKNLLDIHWAFNTGALYGFITEPKTSIGDQWYNHLENQQELALFAGPQLYFAMPVNVTVQLNFGVRFYEEFNRSGFVFKLRVF